MGRDLDYESPETRSFETLGVRLRSCWTLGKSVRNDSGVAYASLSRTLSKAGRFLLKATKSFDDRNIRLQTASSSGDDVDFRILSRSAMPACKGSRALSLRSPDAWDSVAETTIRTQYSLGTVTFVVSLLWLTRLSSEGLDAVADGSSGNYEASPRWRSTAYAKT